MYIVAIFPALLCLCSIVSGQLSDPATLGATIKENKDYQLLPPCVNQCLWDAGSNDTPKIGGDLAIHLSCSSPWVNGCYCRGASAGYAHSCRCHLELLWTHCPLTRGIPSVEAKNEEPLLAMEGISLTLMQSSQVAPPTSAPHQNRAI